MVYYIGLGLIVFSLWMVYEMWRAPMMEETEDGRLVEKKPAKKFIDLFKNK